MFGPASVLGCRHTGQDKDPATPSGNEQSTSIIESFLHFRNHSRLRPRLPFETRPFYSIGIRHDGDHNDQQNEIEPSQLLESLHFAEDAGINHSYEISQLRVLEGGRK